MPYIHNISSCNLFFFHMHHHYKWGRLAQTLGVYLIYSLRKIVAERCSCVKSTKITLLWITEKNCLCWRLCGKVSSSRSFKLMIKQLRPIWANESPKYKLNSCFAEVNMLKKLKFGEQLWKQVYTLSIIPILGFLWVLAATFGCMGASENPCVFTE